MGAKGGVSGAEEAWGTVGVSEVWVGSAVAGPLGAAGNLVAGNLVMVVGEDCRGEGGPQQQGRGWRAAGVLVTCGMLSIRAASSLRENVRSKTQHWASSMIKHPHSCP